MVLVSCTNAFNDYIFATAHYMDTITAVLKDQIDNPTMHQYHTPQCTCPISHDAPFYNRNVHMFVHLSKKNNALWDIYLIHHVRFVRLADKTTAKNSGRCFGITKLDLLTQTNGKAKQNYVYLSSVENVHNFSQELLEQQI